MSSLAVALQSYEMTDKTVTTAHFGGNTVYTRNTDNGSPDSEYTLAMDSLEVSGARFPAGEAETDLDIIVMPGGQLSADLVNFMDWCVAEGQMATLVVPTSVTHTAQEIQAFVNAVMDAYGPHIASFEVGNEYWAFQGESAYGAAADHLVTNIAQALEGSALDPDILVQMANPTGAASDFGSTWAQDTGYTGGNVWGNRLEGANTAIISELSEYSLAQMDALVEHYYYIETHTVEEGFQDNSDEVFYIDVKYDIWTQTTGREYELHLTEWNTKTSNVDQLGLKSASVMVQQFGYMMDMGVDVAFVWPVKHNTASDLAGGLNVPVATQNGIVVNNVQGAIFDLMSSSLVGKTRLDLSENTISNDVAVNAYIGSGELVVYLASRTTNPLDLDFDISGFGLDIEGVSGVVVGYNQATANGIVWSTPEGRFIEADSVTIEGQPYYLNEHDAMAEVWMLDQQALGLSGDALSVSLNPYQVVELTFDLGAMPIEGTSGADTLSGSAMSDTIQGRGGDDSLSGGDGDDEIWGNFGADTISGGAGEDVIRGNNGDDLIHGDEGNDQIWGDEGSDVIYGGAGADVIDAGDGSNEVFAGRDGDTVTGGGGADRLFGQRGADTLNGNAGNDYLAGGTGADQVNGGAGVDDIQGNRGSDTLYGGDGDDLLSGGRNGDTIYGEAGNDTLNGGNGSDTLDGGEGNDTLIGASGMDTLIGGAGTDTLEGGTARDTLTGGSGADVFIFRTTVVEAQDTITDFVIGQDRLSYDGSGLISIIEGSTHVTFDDGDSVVLTGVVASSYGELF